MPQPNIERYYAIADIHGNSDILKAGLEYLYKQEPSGATIIFLGDYIDRGPDPVGVLELVMNPPENWTFIPLLGNHEDMFVHAVENMDMDLIYDLTTYIKLQPNLDKYVEWMKTLKKMHHIRDKNVFAHAYYSPLRELGLNMLLYYRFPSGGSYVEGDYYLTHGHTPNEKGQARHYENRTCLDTFAVATNKLAIGEFHAGKRGPIYIHNITME